MQEKDAATNEYIKDPKHVADMMNGFVFKGQQLWQAEDVKELGERITRIASDCGKVKANEVILDVVKMVCKGMMVTIIHLQNQSDIHYAMPVRVMNEEASHYHRQWKRAANLHAENKDLQGAERLSGFAKGEKLPSIATIVVYWGQDAWDGPRRLKDMLNVDDYPLEFQQLIVDYPIHILEVRRFEHPEVFQTDLKYVFGFLQRDKDKEGLAKYVQAHKEVFSELPESTYNVICTMSKCTELKKVKKNVKKEEGEYDMCQAITEMIEEGREEGKLEGISLGISQGKREMCRIMIFPILEKLGKVSEELSKKIKEEDNSEILENWIHHALSARTMDEFEAKMVLSKRVP